MWNRCEGGPALLNLISGVVNPSAQLSVSWPRSVGGIGSQTPYLQQFALHYRETYQEEPTSPLFRFGYGMSYSNFSVGQPRLVSSQGQLIRDAIAPNDTVHVHVNLTNQQGPAGVAVVQLYFQQATAPVIRYYQQLIGYRLTRVEQGGVQDVMFELKVQDLAYWDNLEAGHLPGEPGWQLGVKGRETTFTLMVGLSAAECNGSGSCDLQSVPLVVLP